MKTPIVICLTTLFVQSFTLSAANQKRAARLEAAFQKTWDLVNSDRFLIRFYMATPSAQTFIATPSEGANISINPQRAYLRVNDSLVNGKLPYYGQGYWKGKSGEDTLSFHHILFSRTVKILQGGNKKAIAYQLSLLTTNNIYFLHLDIQYDGTCYLYLSDKRRSPISYTGQLFPLPSSKEKISHGQSRQDSGQVSQ